MTSLCRLAKCTFYLYKYFFYRVVVINASTVIKMLSVEYNDAVNRL